MPTLLFLTTWNSLFPAFWLTRPRNQFWTQAGDCIDPWEIVATRTLKKGCQHGKFIEWRNSSINATRWHDTQPKKNCFVDAKKRNLKALHDLLHLQEAYAPKRCLQSWWICMVRKAVATYSKLYGQICPKENNERLHCRAGSTAAHTGDCMRSALVFLIWCHASEGGVNYT